MAERPIRYEDKFVAFVDILGFKQIVERSAINDDAEAIVRIIDKLAPENDIAFYQEDGAEICPCSEKHSANLAMRISQVSDCVVVSAEVSPAGAINIVNFCRKVAVRLLLREAILCRGYLTRGKIVHEGKRFFGPGYQAAVDGEKKAVAIEFQGEKMGTPFIEVDPAVVSYFEAHGDDCTRKKFSQMTISGTEETYISPFGIFDQFADWASDLPKSPENRLAGLDLARNFIDRIERGLSGSKPVNSSAEKKVQISRKQVSNARDRLAEAEEMLASLMGPFPTQ